IPHYMNFGYKDEIITTSINNFNSANISFINQKFVIIHDYEYIKDIDTIINYFLKGDNDTCILATSTISDEAKKMVNLIF
ncbi:MAG: hypothetical protein K2L48_03235, partial [Mycoplasmoidaceae bacterium]|nr:hypothetical protein [Mycoplasmoidaceae bacterium]